MVAAALGKLFATRIVKKTYWAVVKGLPSPPQGKIEVALIKAKGPDGDRMLGQVDVRANLVELHRLDPGGLVLATLDHAVLIAL